MPHSPEPLAHSSRGSAPAQTYRDHVQAVRELAARMGRDAVRFAAAGERATFLAALDAAACFHDLGKLDEVFQRALRANARETGINHVDAGVARLLTLNAAERGGYIEAAIAVYSHHLGLPCFSAEHGKNTPALKGAFRDLEGSVEATGLSTWKHVDRCLPEYLERHGSLCPAPLHPSAPWPSAAGLARRLLLSCLVDADHSDTAAATGQAALPPAVPLRPDARLAALDAYVAGLGSDSANGAEAARRALRRDLYRACHDRPVGPRERLFACDSPVGTGKTTAVMAYLLRMAAERGLRRIFVVLPFTSIIDQSVAVYRRALLLPGEPPEAVVAAHHHRADFSDPALRSSAARWDAPVVVTTGVQFFETLAACQTAALRKLHQLPGSAVFIDEAHAALPGTLWPQALRWLCGLCEGWGCHAVFASGSLVRIWDLEDCVTQAQRPTVSDLVAPAAGAAAHSAERRRVAIRRLPEPLSLAGLADAALAQPGPRLIILNTVQSAAVVARYLRDQRGAEVEHLSTALCPADRAPRLGAVSARLLDRARPDWTLVATSCVEAGLDFSFRSALRESWGVANLIQVAGRVNRNHEYPEATVWDFRHDGEAGLSLHPQAELQRAILAELWKRCAAECRQPLPSDCTEAFRLELRNDHGVRAARIAEIAAAEGGARYPTVEKLFRVIDAPTHTVLVDSAVASRLAGGGWPRPDWREIVAHSVQLWSHQLNPSDFPVKPIAGGELWQWIGAYDTFLGYMAGLLDLKSTFLPGGGVL